VQSHQDGFTPHLHITFIPRHSLRHNVNATWLLGHSANIGVASKNAKFAF